jgi:ribosomal protein L32
MRNNVDPDVKPPTNEIAKSDEVTKLLTICRKIDANARKKEDRSSTLNWLQCPNCDAVGMAGTLCANCGDTGMIHSELRATAEGTRWMYGRLPWMSRMGQFWRESFKKKTHETLFKGMMVMIGKGPSDRLFQIGRIHHVTKRYVDVDYYLKREELAIWQRVHMHSILVIHRGAKVTVDQNGVMFVEQREDAEIHAGGEIVSDDEIMTNE